MGHVVEQHKLVLSELLIAPLLVEHQHELEHAPCGVDGEQNVAAGAHGLEHLGDKLRVAILPGWM